MNHRTAFNSCSHRMQAVQDPIIPQVAQWIKNNPGTLSLGQGIVGYPPPNETLQHLQGMTDIRYQEYSSVRGEPLLLARIEEKLAEDNGIEINSDKQFLMLTAGSNMAFLLALYCITSPGDEVILLSPFYFNHDMAINMVSCKTIPVATDINYQPDLNALRAALSEKTRAIVTVSPNNPTGAVYSQSTLKTINDLCKDNGIYHISDEAYEYFTYKGKTHFSPASIVDAETHTISLFSLSKSFGFSAWRVGYLILPAHLQHAALKAQDTQLICVPIQSQIAALGALNAGKKYALEYLPELDQKRQMIEDELNKLPSIINFSCPEGAFYYYLTVKTEMSARQLSQYLIEEYKVALIPGETFGDHSKCKLRLSYGAQKKEQLAIAIDRFMMGIQFLDKKMNPNG